MAENIGFEKIVLKQSKLLGYFISDAHSGYYQFEKFSKILQLIQRSDTCQMKEKNNKLYLIYNNKIESINEVLNYISDLNSQLQLERVV